MKKKKKMMAIQSPTFFKITKIRIQVPITKFNLAWFYPDTLKLNTIQNATWMNKKTPAWMTLTKLYALLMRKYIL